jgi:hypothetical protein
LYFVASNEDTVTLNTNGTVLVEDCETDKLTEYTSIKDAFEALGITQENIKNIRCANDRFKTRDDYLVKYIEFVNSKDMVDCAVEEGVK